MNQLIYNRTTEMYFYGEVLRKSATFITLKVTHFSSFKHLADKIPYQSEQYPDNVRTFLVETCTLFQPTKAGVR